MELSGTLAEPSDNSPTPYIKKRPTLLGQPLSVESASYFTESATRRLELSLSVYLPVQIHSSQHQL